MNFLDKLQQAWQSQCSKPVEVNPDRILEIARQERQVHFWVDTSLIAFFLLIGVVSLGWVLRDIHKDWPWLVYTGCDAWVAGFVLISQWRRRNRAAHVDAPLLSHVEWSIKDIEQRMWQDRYTFWWYILPIALGCMIPPVLFFAMDDSKRPLLDSLIPMLISEGCLRRYFYVRLCGHEIRREHRR